MSDLIKEYLPFLIPLIIIQFVLMIAAVIHIIRHDKFRFGNKALWIIISVFLNIIGPVLYFTIGRSDD
ncbi:hypothetical protein A5844_000836 [Enterococcus sp. 10A9_DIV0425]|uniref:Cardiolipin synthase N-terminal domain-containing protein n=1 Tax=Candidatus Enterococcus wittei TaxID=1987383 RepID=A0A2C9XQY8_9ENTE|nr:PLD nuclease N-terminal domain-containing protein [Enterococcus sp. 10A9_DIV0425]OTP12603.1 hypothetical protein A5844_000836 [Enterococcus sp. 10A9_DIV0425]THE15588.1 PLDc_N domain-containing protein [Enterococcus hirae]